jgi:SAM-dependent methyltransferase
MPNQTEMWEDIWDGPGTIWNPVSLTDPIYERLALLVRERGIKSVLELGCATAPRSTLLQRVFGLERVVVVDQTASALRAAKRFALGYGADTSKIEFLQADMFSLPSLGTFDLVWSGGVHEHFVGDVRQQSFDLMLPLVNPRGPVYVLVPNRLSAPYGLHRALHHLRGTWNVGFEDPMTPWELRRRMIRAGLQDVRLDCVDWFHIRPFEWTYQSTMISAWGFKP